MMHYDALSMLENLYTYYIIIIILYGDMNESYVSISLERRHFENVLRTMAKIILRYADYFSLTIKSTARY